MLELCIHSITKNKTLITSLNKLGICASYNSLKRYRTRLAECGISNCSTGVPLPSHLGPQKYTTKASDNFDYNKFTESGLHTSHDTV